MFSEAMGDEEVDKTEVLFRTLNADDPEATEIESLCMECGENVGSFNVNANFNNLCTLLIFVVTFFRV
jgi:hypothetical protein